MSRAKALFLLYSVCGFAARAAETTYTIQTVAGSSLVGDGGPALAAQISDAQGVAIDRSGAVYIADPANHRVRRVNPSGLIDTVAGTGFPGFSGDGGPATGAKLNAPYGVAVDPAGSLYIADLGNHRVRKVSGGVITTFAGTGQAGSGGDGGRAGAAQLYSPRNVAIDAIGSVYIAEFDGHRVRQVTPDGLIRTVLLAPDVAYPAGLAIDAAGALYVADSGNQRIRKLSGGVVTTVDLPGFTLSAPAGVAVDGAGGISIADSGNRRILRRTSAGAIVVVAGKLDSARDVAAGPAGDLLIADGRRVRLITVAGFAVPLAGDGTFGYRGDGGPAAAAVLNGPSGVAVDAGGSLYIADERNHRVRKVSPGGTIATVAGTGSPAIPLEGLAATSTALTAPEGVLADAGGVLWIAEYYGARIRKVTPAGTILTIAGNGTPGFNGDGRPATTAQLQTPAQIALDSAGDLYVADSGNHRIRKVTPAGVITTFAGSGVAGFSGDGGQAISAQLNAPRGIAFDAADNLYIADTNNFRIRRVTPGGQITTVAGEGEFPLNFPRAVAVDAAQNLYIADTANHRILLRTAAGVMSVIAGVGAAGFGGDGGPALAAALSSPAAIAGDAQGNLYIADLDNNRVRKLTPFPGEIPAAVTQPAAARVLHAATRKEGPVAPGEIVSIAADGAGPAVEAAGVFDDAGFLPVRLGDAQVLFDGRAAPLVSARAGEIQAQVPYETDGQPATHIEIFRAGERKAETTVAVTRAAPGIFAALIANADGSLNSDASPAAPGSTVTLLLTGEGQTIPAGIDGRRSVEPYAQPVGTVGAHIAGMAADVLFAVEAPGQSGVLRVDIVVPAGSGSGPGAAQLSIGGAVTQDGVTVWVK